MPEYMIERDENGKALKTADGGVWTENYYDLPILIGEVLVKFLDDSISPEVYEAMDKIAAKYTQENAEKMLVEIYQGFINQRIQLFYSALVQNAPQPPTGAPVPTDPAQQINYTEPPVVK